MPKPTVLAILDLQETQEVINISCGEDIFAGKRFCGEFCDMQADEDEHPNESPFSGTLLIVNRPSDKPPNGAQNHRIYISSKVAEEKLPTLIGMGLNYSKDLSQHAPRHKVGVIKEAWIDGNKVRVKGVVWKKDFPEAADDLKSSKMGMSMELGNVKVRDADEDVWHLVDFHFTGATALYKDAAAYYQTSLAAAAQAVGFQFGGAKEMPKDNDTKNKNGSPTDGKSKTENLLETIAASVSASVGAAVKEAMSPLAETLNAIKEGQEELAEAVIEAAGKKDEEEEDEDMSAGKKKPAAAEEDDTEDDTDDEDDMKAGKKKDDDEDDDDEDEMMAEIADLAKAGMKNSIATGDEDSEPGKLNKTAKNKGRKNSISAASRTIRSISAQQVQISELQAANRKLAKIARSVKAENSELRTEVDDINAQIDKFTNESERRSLPPDLTMILEKGGFNVSEMHAQGQKLSVSQVDEMFASLAESGVQLGVVDRAKMKNILLEKGLMDEGRVVRSR